MIDDSIGAMDTPVGMPELHEDPPIASPSRPQRIWPTFVVPFLGIVLVVVAQATVVEMALATLGVVEFQRWFSSAVGFLALIGSSQLGLLIPTTLAARLSPVPFCQRLGLVRIQDSLRISTVLALGSVLPLLVGLGMVQWVAQYIPDDGTIARMYESLTPAWAVVFVLVVSIAPGFAEEMLFRGYIQRRLLQRWRPAWAIGVASVIFSLAHISPHGIAIALPLGVWFGVIAWRLGSIIPTIVCHAFVNGALNVWRLTVMFGRLSPDVQFVGEVLFILIGSGFFLLACHVLINAPRPGQPDAQSPKLEPVV